MSSLLRHKKVTNVCKNRSNLEAFAATILQIKTNRSAVTQTG